jgi:two-component system, chemotaxis family, protein-glutamate methylesterase/glutaminase
MTAPIRVLVVDDSALIRQMLTRALALDPRIEIIGTARNGVEAIEKVGQLNPDVITLDIEMPELTGLEALPYIIKSSPARVLMLSSVDDPDTTYQALSHGAVDFISKPKGGFASSLSELADFLIKKIKTAYRIDPSKRLRADFATQAATVPAPSGGESAAERKTVTATLERLVCIASSTGGPPALERVFADLGPDLPAAFLVVQHLPAGFTGSLAGRLTRIAGFPVVEAQQGMRLEPAKGYLAPYGTHMIITGMPGRLTSIDLKDAPALHGVRPAADPLFASAAALYGDHVTGVVLTGMGTDGAQGLSSIREAGGRTIVQDEESAVVWGMPGAAVRTGAAESVVPLGRMALEIRRTLRNGS